MSNQPLDRGQVCFVAERYESKEVDQQTRQKIMKNRYAQVGRCTLWPGQQGRANQCEIELDTVPIGRRGPLKLVLFWDSERQRNQGQPAGQQTGQHTGFPDQQHYDQGPPNYR